MNKITLAIAIPTYNGENYIHGAIESALNQIRPADEIVIVDDNSNDNTCSIIQSFHSPYIRLFINNHATGFVDAWNRLADYCQSEYITILHQDDLLHPEYLLNIEKAIKLYPGVSHFFCACNIINYKGTIIRNAPLPHNMEPVYLTGVEYAKKYISSAYLGNHIHRCPGVTTNVKLLRNECQYRKEAGHIADDDFFIRIGKYTDVVGISYPLAYYREHSESETGKKISLCFQLFKDFVFQYHETFKEDSLIKKERSTILKLSGKFLAHTLFQFSYYFDKNGIMHLQNFIYLNNVSNTLFWLRWIPGIHYKFLWLLISNRAFALAKLLSNLIFTIAKLKK